MNLNPSEKSQLLFFLGCIPARILLAYIAYVLCNSSSPLKNIFIILTFIMGLGFWTIYLKGWRKTGAETFGQKIWWNHLRPIHGTIYLLFSISALLGSKNAWMFLAIDVLIGIIAELRVKK